MKKQERCVGLDADMGPGELCRSHSRILQTVERHRLQQLPCKVIPGQNILQVLVQKMTSLRLWICCTLSPRQTHRYPSCAQGQSRGQESQAPPAFPRPMTERALKAVRARILALLRIAVRRRMLSVTGKNLMTRMRPKLVHPPLALRWKRSNGNARAVAQALSTSYVPAAAASSRALVSRREAAR